jgi:DNA-binding NarL/FixJ family response regulator
VIKLSSRETQILSLYLKEGDLRKVADKLGVSISTVKTHRSNIMAKLGVRNAVELTLSAIKRGLVSPTGRNE